MYFQANEVFFLILEAISSFCSRNHVWHYYHVENHTRCLVDT